MSDTMSDPVTAPSHYLKTTDSVECIDAIEASMSREAFGGYLKGSVLKYAWRYEEKNHLEDLRKCKVFLDWLIAHEMKTTLR
jgi:hypothetical protein